MISTELPIIAPQWDAPDNVLAYSTTRIGGVSVGKFNALNLGLHVGDDPNLVHANRAMLPQHHSIQWLDQVHGNAVIDISDCPSILPKADAAYANVADRFCAVMTADCVPILVTNTAGDEVSAIHAGWRGLANGVIRNAISCFKTEAHDLLAWIGPCISQPSYEVDRATAEHFQGFADCIIDGEKGRFHLDLSNIAQHQLLEIGLDKVYQSNMCTYKDDKKFFSHRKACHQGLSACGRQVSVIGFT